MKNIKLYLLIIGLSIPPLVQMMTTLDLPHTSDGLMHVARSAAYLKELEAGQIPVRWAHQFNYGYGTPIFNFFNPLPYIIGAILLWFGLSLATILKIGFAISFILGGVFMFLFSKTLFKNTKTAILTTIMFQYVPFRLVEMHTRGDLGSLYSYAVIPLVLFSILKFTEKHTYPRFFLLAISSALLPYVHNINGFVYFCMSILFVLFVTQKWKKVVITWITMLVGLLSISYYLLPALLELRYLNGYIFSKHLFYMHFPEVYKLLLPNITNNPSLRVAEVAVQIGFFNVIALGGIFYLLVKKKLTGRLKKISYYLAITTAITFFIMLPVSKPLWENIEYLRQFQFPWRFLLVFVITSPIAAGILFSKIKVLHSDINFVLILALIMLSTVLYWGPYQGYQKIDENYYRNYPQSTNYFAEVNTIWMEKEPQQYPNSRVDVIAGDAKIEDVEIQPERHLYKVHSNGESNILDRTYFYPGWKVFVNGTDTPIQFQDPNHRGLITFTVPAGENLIEVRFSQNRNMLIGNMITIISFSLFGIGWIYHSLRKAKK